MSEQAAPRAWIVALLAVVIAAAPCAASAQSHVEPGFTLFDPEEDIEIGRRSAEQVESQFPVLENRVVTRYIDRLGARLADNAPGYDFPYQFEVLDVADVNAFALPGGFLYLNRGLLARGADTEPQLAAVMAHEIAHVALRHGTSRASKAYLGQAGLSLISGLVGGESTSDVIGAVGGFGLNALFLKFSREDEEEADIVAAQILARSGYDPTALVAVFDSLQAAAEGSGGGGVPTFLSSHPPYADRRDSVRDEAGRIGQVETRRPIGGFDTVRAELASSPDPRQMDDYTTRRTTDDEHHEHDEHDAHDRSAQRHGDFSDVRIEPASSEWITYRDDRGYFSVSVPDNWTIRQAERGFGATFVPPGGMVHLDDSRSEVIYGVILSHFTPRDIREARKPWYQSFTSERDWKDDPASWLERASGQLVDALQDSNPHLKPRPASDRARSIDDDRAYAVTLAGHNPVTDRDEKVIVVTRKTDADGHLAYALLIAPERDWDLVGGVFSRMMDSLEINDRAVHGSEASR